MATDTIYGDIYGYLRSYSGTYATARAGTGSMDVEAATQYQLYVGQGVPAGTYSCYESYLAFDTSAIPDSNVVSDVKLYLYGDGSGPLQTHCTLEVRARDFGASVDSTDWVAGADLGDYTLLASHDTSGGWATDAYNVLTGNADFRAAINKAGYTRIMLNVDKHRAGDVPTNWSLPTVCSPKYSGTSEDPYIVVTHAPPASASYIPAVMRHHIIGRGIHVHG